MPKLRPYFANWWLGIGLIILFSGLYLANIDGWLMHDDEGTDFYEVWQARLRVCCETNPNLRMLLAMNKTKVAIPLFVFITFTALYL